MHFNLLQLALTPLVSSNKAQVLDRSNEMWDKGPKPLRLVQLQGYKNRELKGIIGEDRLNS